MACPVKHFTSAMAGMPALTGNSAGAGSLIAVLDACLVNGANLQTLTGLAVSSNVATATKAGHGFVEDQIVLVSGATPAGLNGEWKIASTTVNTFTFSTTGISDQAATGTITAKAAPAGWSKAFSGTSKAAYVSGAMLSSKPYLRVDDSAINAARVVGYESMTDVDTGIGGFPTSVQQSGGFYWPRSSTNDATGREWVLVASDLFFMVFIKSNGINVLQFSFGDLASYKSGDAFNGFLSGSVSLSYTVGGGDVVGIGSNIAAYGFGYMARSYTQLGGAVAVAQVSVLRQIMGESMTLGYYGSGDTGGSPAVYPSPVDNGLVFAPFYIREQVTGVWRARRPGLFCLMQANPLGHLDKVINIDDLPGRTLLMLRSDGNGYEYRVAVDITGPW